MKSKRLVIVAMISIFSIQAYSQFEPLVNLSVGFILNGIPCDLDGDDDLDILLYSSNANEIYWRENIDGDFATHHTVMNDFISFRNFKHGDLDGDNDIDFAVLKSGSLCVFENTDGLGNFGEEIFVCNASDYVSDLYIADVDTDGDQDIVLRCGISDATTTVSWLENIENTFEFEAEQAIIDPSTRVKAMCFSDLNGDLKTDIVLGFNNRISWLRNLGNGEFSTENYITTSVNEVISVRAADIDGDGANDVIAASYNDNKLSWYKNSGIGAFGNQQLLVNPGNGGYQLLPIDIDNDDDIDLLGVSIYFEYFKKLFYYENYGSGSFSAAHLLADSAPIYEAFVGDIDNDNDQDIFTLHRTDIYGSGSFYFCENNLLTANPIIFENENCSAYPNPVIDRLNIKIDDDENYSIEVYDLSGKLVYAKNDITKSNSSINLTDLKNGLYIGKLKPTSDDTISKEIKIVIQR